MRSKSSVFAFAPIIIALAAVTGIASADSIICKCVNQTYGSGWVTGGYGPSTKYDDTVVRGRFNTSAVNLRGFCDFGLAALNQRNPKEFGQVILHYFEYSGYSSPTAYLRYCPNADPVQQTANSLYDSLGAPSGFPLGSQPYGLGWHDVTLPAWEQWPDTIPVNSVHMVISWLSAESDDCWAKDSGRLSGDHYPYLVFKE